jgi:hypothetical protein
MCQPAALENTSTDVVHSIVCGLLPRDVVAMSLAARALHITCQGQRQGASLGRHRLRTRLRGVRTQLEYRQAFVESICTGAPLSVQQCLPKLLRLLSSSSDGVRDLAAAVQKTLQRVDTQNMVPPTALVRVHQDCLNVASFVCLLAWKSRMRSRRASRAAAEEQGGVQVVAFEQPEEPAAAEDQTQPAASSSSSRSVSMATSGSSSRRSSGSAAGSSSMSTGELSRASSAHAEVQVDPGMIADSTIHPPASGMPPAAAPEDANPDTPSGSSSSLNNQDAATNHPHQQRVAPAQVRLQSMGIQTEHSGDLKELQDLLAGFQAISCSPNVHLRFAAATMQLLLHQMEKEVASWHMHPAEAVAEQVLGEVVAAAAAAVAGNAAAAAAAAGAAQNDAQA